MVSFLTSIPRRVPADEYKCNSTLEDKQGMDFKIDLGTYMKDEVREKSIYCDKRYPFLLHGLIIQRPDIL